MFILLFIILWLIIWVTLLEKDMKKSKKQYIKKINTLIKRVKSIEENQNVAFGYINDIYDDLERFDINEEN